MHSLHDIAFSVHAQVADCIYLEIQNREWQFTQFISVPVARNSKISWVLFFVDVSGSHVGCWKLASAMCLQLCWSSTFRAVPVGTLGWDCVYPSPGNFRSILRSSCIHGASTQMERRTILSYIYTQTSFLNSFKHGNPVRLLEFTGVNILIRWPPSVGLWMCSLHPCQKMKCFIPAKQT